MKRILPISAALMLATTSIAVAQDAAGVLASAQQAMGLAGATSLSITANGSLKDNGEAAGGNAPVPVVAEYQLDLDLAAPGSRLRIHRTNPDGTELGYGGTELQFVSGDYVWQVFTGQSMPAGGGGGGPPPGGGGGAPPDGAGGPPAGGAPPAGAGGPPAGGAPPAGAGGPPADGAAAGGPPPGFGAPSGPPPKPEDTFEGAGGPTVLTGALAEARQVQLALTPAGFVALATKSNPTATSEGDDQVVSFSTTNGTEIAGTFGADGLLKEVNSVDPLTGQPLKASFEGYQQFGGLTYPSTITQTEDGTVVASLTVTALRGAIEVISVPASVASYEGP